MVNCIKYFQQSGMNKTWKSRLVGIRLICTYQVGYRLRYITYMNLWIGCLCLRLQFWIAVNHYSVVKVNCQVQVWGCGLLVFLIPDTRILLLTSVIVMHLSSKHAWNILLQHSVSKQKQTLPGLLFKIHDHTQSNIEGIIGNQCLWCSFAFVYHSN